MRLPLLVLVALLAACSKQPGMQPLATDAVILAFGDSITQGTGASPETAYPAVLEALTGREVVNAGIAGEVSQYGLTRLPRLLEKHQPDLVIICHGGNDIMRKLDLDRTRANIAEMIDLVRSTGAQVVLIGVPRFGVFLKSATFYSELAEEKNVPLENEALPSILKNRALKADQVHPNASGYSYLAERITDLLMETGAISIRY